MSLYPRAPRSSGARKLSSPPPALFFLTIFARIGNIAGGIPGLIKAAGHRDKARSRPLWFNCKEDEGYRIFVFVALWLIVRNSRQASHIWTCFYWCSNDCVRWRNRKMSDGWPRREETENGNVTNELRAELQARQSTRTARRGMKKKRGKNRKEWEESGVEGANTCPCHRAISPVVRISRNLFSPVNHVKIWFVDGFYSGKLLRMLRTKFEGGERCGRCERARTQRNASGH